MAQPMTMISAQIRFLVSSQHCCVPSVQFVVVVVMHDPGVRDTLCSTVSRFGACDPEDPAVLNSADRSHGSLVGCSIEPGPPSSTFVCLLFAFCSEASLPSEHGNGYASRRRRSDQLSAHRLGQPSSVLERLDYSGRVLGRLFHRAGPRTLRVGQR